MDLVVRLADRAEAPTLAALHLEAAPAGIDDLRHRISLDP